MQKHRIHSTYCYHHFTCQCHEMNTENKGEAIRCIKHHRRTMNLNYGITHGPHSESTSFNGKQKLQSAIEDDAHEKRSHPAQSLYKCICTTSGAHRRPPPSDGTTFSNTLSNLHPTRDALTQNIASNTPCYQTTSVAHLTNCFNKFVGAQYLFQQGCHMPFPLPHPPLPPRPLA